MSDTAVMILIHVIAATPPTLAALAALITARKTRRDTQRIVIAVNGERDRMRRELEQMRRAFADHQAQGKS